MIHATPARARSTWLVFVRQVMASTSLPYVTSILSALLLAFGGALRAAPVAISLDTTGGEAWSFSKRIEGRLSEVAACDRVVVHAPAGSISALVAGERFAADVPLHGGENVLHASCHRDGTEMARTRPQKWVVRLPDVPKAWVRTRVTERSVTMDAERTERASGLPARIVRYEWWAHDGNPAPLTLLASSSSSAAVDASKPAERRLGEGAQIEIRSPRADGDYYVTLRVTDSLGRTDEGAAVFRVEGGKPVEIDLRREHPLWVDGAVVYGVAPFFFGPSAFKGITARLDAIVALGATALWLSPVTESPPDDFGYAVVNHFRLRDTFGSEADFRALVGAAHARGLRVLMDFVPNHVSDRHPYYQDVEKRGTRSPYYHWFERDAEGEVTHYFDWRNLKNLEFDNPEVQRYIIAGFTHWMREYGIDGFRVDASWGVQERAPEFWLRWRDELKRVDPDVFLLAEASARDPYHVANGFDAAYDWTAKLGEWAWREAFGEGGADADVSRLRAAITNEGAGYPPDTLILRFLNNNDTGPRFISRHGLERTRLAAVLLFTLPGIPMVYNGDEVGAAFDPYDEGPPIVWRDEYGLTPHYQQLAELRRETPALRSREIEMVATGSDDAVLAFVRPGGSDRESVLVALNFTHLAAEVSLADPSAAFIAGAEVVEDLLSGSALRIDPQAPKVRLSPYGAVVLRRAR